MRPIVSNIGNVGIIRDVKPHLLPPGVWSNGRNVRFESQRASRMGGVRPLFDDATRPGVLWVGFVNSVGVQAYLYANATDVFSYNVLTDNELTRVAGGDYATTPDALWDMELFNGFAILNNGTDIPQQWNPQTLANKMQNLVNWDSTWRAQTLVGYKAFLIGLNIRKGEDVFDSMIKWSAAAEPGALPITWNVADPTREAGEASLPDTQYGPIVNARVLRDRLMIYKQNSIWALDYVGGVDVFSSTEILPGVGLEYRRTLALVPAPKSRNAYHFFAGEGNFYVNDGLNVEAVFEEIFRKEFLKLVDGTYAGRCFSTVNPKYRELWLCFPEVGHDSCTLAFVWNYGNNTYSIRELGGSLAIAAGLVPGEEDITTPIDIPFSDTSLFSQGVGFLDVEETRQRFTMVEASYQREKMYYLDVGKLGYDAAPMEAYVERIATPSVPARSEMIVDYSVRTQIKHIITKLYEGTAIVQVGAQETDNMREPVFWSVPLETDINLYRQDLPTPISGRFISVRFGSSAEQEFELGGFGFDAESIGEW